MTDRAVFRAVLPNTQGAIRVHGDSGMRITLDVSEDELPEALKLVMWRQRVLVVTVEPEQGEHNSERFGTGLHI